MTERHATLPVRLSGGPEPKVPNAETRAAMAEAEEILKAGRARFAAVEEILADLEEAAHP